MSIPNCLNRARTDGRSGIKAASGAAVTEIERWLCRYEEHLTRFLGLTSASRRQYLAFARQFFTSQFASGEPNWAKINGASVSDFVRQEAARLNNAGRRRPGTAIRSLLRFLVSEGLIAPGLEKAVPCQRQHKHASLPIHLSDDQVKQALKICHADTAIGLRNRAILLLLSRLGIRAGEVIALRLEHIDWIEGKLTIRSSKSLRQRTLPLSREVGSVLAGYLRRGRPKSPSSFLFLRHSGSCGPLTGPSAISQIVRRTLFKAKIELPRKGAHVFRHTAATQMLCRGASFKEIADVLGHKSIETTGIYAKLDLAGLAAVALPWPGGEK